MVSHMVKIGEETGELEKMLSKVADFYEDEVDASIQSLTSIIEPLMMIGVGLMVGVIIISMYLLMFKMLSLRQVARRRSRPDHGASWQCRWSLTPPSVLHANNGSVCAHRLANLLDLRVCCGRSVGTLGLGSSSDAEPRLRTLDADLPRRSLDRRVPGAVAVRLDVGPDLGAGPPGDDDDVPGALVADAHAGVLDRIRPNREGWALGLGIATALAVPIGIVLGSSQFALRAFRIPVEFLRPIPSAALIPLLFLTLGTTLKSEIFLAAFGAFWPLLIQTIYGVRDVDPVTLDTARSFGMGGSSVSIASSCRALCRTSPRACASRRRSL